MTVFLPFRTNSASISYILCPYLFFEDPKYMYIIRLFEFVPWLIDTPHPPSFHLEQFPLLCVQVHSSVLLQSNLLLIPSNTLLFSNIRVFISGSWVFLLPVFPTLFNLLKLSSTFFNLYKIVITFYCPSLLILSFVSFLGLFLLIDFPSSLWVSLPASLHAWPFFIGWQTLLTLHHWALEIFADLWIFANVVLATLSYLWTVWSFQLLLKRLVR